ncbi:hypothetical protein Bresa_00961|nr:hypothetical protein [Brenneria salicis ATCC 15712 = DSM 30166]
MNSIIGIIKFVIGQVFVVALDGSQRLLTAGDRIYSGEEIVTGDNGAVSITLPDGRTLDLGRNSRWSDVAGATPQKTEDAEDDVAALQTAIEQGADPTQVLEATAADNENTGEAGDGGGSHTTVQLDLTGQIVDVTVGYPTQGIGFATDEVEEFDDADPQSLTNTQLSEGNTGNSDVITLSSNSQVTEGGSFTVTATVGSPVTGSPLVIMLSNNQIITIPVGERTGSVQIATRGDDFYQQGDESLTIGIRDTVGGNYQALDTTSTTTTTVVDDVDMTAITLSSDNQVTEGGAFIVTATIGAPVTGSPLVITLSNDQTLTIPVGERTSTVQVESRADDSYRQGDEALTIGIKETSGGNYEALDTSSTTTTTVVDNSDATILTLGDITVTEGSGTATIGATLSQPTDREFTVTLSNGATITFAANSATATSTAFAVQGDDVYQDGESYAVSVVDTGEHNFEQLDSSNTATVTVTDTEDTTAITLSSDNQVTEGGAFTVTATVGTPVTGSPLVITLSNDQTLTIAVGESSGSIQIETRGDDRYQQGDDALTIGIKETSGGNYEALDTSSTTTTTVVDNSDATTLTLGDITVTEGSGTATIGATLSQPTDRELPLRSAMARPSPLPPTVPPRRQRRLRYKAMMSIRTVKAIRSVSSMPVNITSSNWTAAIPRPSP